MFTVSSAYQLSCSLRQVKQSHAETSRSQEENSRMWKKVWQMNIKPKLKHFLWRCLHDWLATGSTIQKRGMTVDGTCRRCGLAEETREHMFFHCSESVII